MVKHDPKLGTILADAQGLTLYTLTNNGKAVDCTGACASVWPPLTASAGAAPAAAPGVPMLGTASLSDGTHVVTAGGLPVYRYAQDQDSGDAYGEGITSFGGVWRVVRTGQSTASAAPTASGRTSAGY
jgi:predicted lipoprotein with Yx(FWY)xxD motif